jgi:hypothetical protein
VPGSKWTDLPQATHRRARIHIPGADQPVPERGSRLAHGKRPDEGLAHLDLDVVVEPERDRPAVPPKAHSIDSYRQQPRCRTYLVETEWSAPQVEELTEHVGMPSRRLDVDDSVLGMDAEPEVATRSMIERSDRRLLHYRCNDTDTGRERSMPFM